MEKWLAIDRKGMLMIDVINKTVGFVLNPLFVGMMIIAAAFVLAFLRKLKAVLWMLGIGLAWFWFGSRLIQLQFQP